MNKRIRINGKLYEAVEMADKNDIAMVKRLADKADDVIAKGKLSRNSVDTLYDITMALLQVLQNSSRTGEEYKYNAAALQNAVNRLEKSRKKIGKGDTEDEDFDARPHGPRRF